MTPEGYLSFIAPIARTGKLTYLDSKTGQLYNETVPPETLIDSAKTFRRKPITFGHPKVKVDSRNYSQYLKGTHGDREYFQQDKGLLWFSGTVFDHASIESIKSGEAKEISNGYDGYVMLKADERTQVKRIGNHSAIVPYGRAGKEVSFKIDADDTETIYAWVLNEDSDLVIPDAPDILVSELKSKGVKYFTGNPIEPGKEPQPGIIHTQNKDGSKMVQILLGKKIFNIDGADAEALRDAVSELEEKVETSIETAATSEATAKEVQTKLDAAATELATVKGQLTAKDTQLTEVQTKLDAGVDFSTEIKNRLDAWSQVESFIAKVQPSFKRDEHLGMSVPEIQRLYLGHRYPQLKTHLDSLDLTDPVKLAEITGMYAASIAAQSKTTEPTHTDSVLNILTASNGHPMNTTTHNDSGHEFKLDSDPMKITNEDAQTNLEQLRAKKRAEIENAHRQKREARKSKTKA